MGAQPADQLLAAGSGRVERLDAEHGADVIDHCGDVHISVRVDTSGHRT